MQVYKLNKVDVYFKENDNSKYRIIFRIWDVNENKPIDVSAFFDETQFKVKISDKKTKRTTMGTNIEKVRLLFDDNWTKIANRFNFGNIEAQLVCDSILNNPTLKKIHFLVDDLVNTIRFLNDEKSQAELNSIIKKLESEKTDNHEYAK